jgi:hypothetical protein
MSGGKGGSTTQQVQIPEWVQGPAQVNLERANQAANIGYTPFYGADVAAFSPQQVQGMQATADAAAAMGLAPQTNVAASMPQAQNYGGIMGYSSAPMYEQALAELQARRPGQFDAYNAMFVNQQTGQAPEWYTNMVAAQAQAAGGAPNTVNTGLDYGSGDANPQVGMSTSNFNSQPQSTQQDRAAAAAQAALG